MSCRKLAETLEAYDGLELYCEIYKSQATKGVIIAVHDYGEHVGIYQSVFERLAGQHYTVYAMDLRGHGKSPGDRAFIGAFDDFLDDLDLLLARARDRESEQAGNIFLLGQGLGALIAARFAFMRQPRLQGLVLCGPLLDLPLSRMERTLLQISGPFFSGKDFAPAAKSSWLEPKLLGPLKDDALAFRGSLKLSTVREIVSACAELRSLHAKLNYGLLTLVGRQASARQLQLTEELQEAVLAADKTLLSYEGMDQNMLLHAERDQVVGDILDWFDRQRNPLGQAIDEEEEEDVDDSL